MIQETNLYNANRQKAGYWEEKVHYVTLCKVNEGYKRGYYINGKKHGIWESFQLGGILVSSHNYDQGLLTGKFYNYHFDKGSIKTNGEYLNGISCGFWQYFDEEGIITEEIVCII